METSIALTLLLAAAAHTLVSRRRSRRALAAMANRRAFVTGGTAGIGLEIAKRLSSLGCHVVLCGCAGDAAVAEATASVRRARCTGGVQVAGFRADLSSKEGCEAAWATATLAVGAVDLLLLNHCEGWYGQPLAGSGAWEVAERQMRVNALAHFELASLALPGLERHRAGGIVVVSSLAGRMGLPLTAPYAASKHALHGWFESVRFHTSAAITLVTLGNIGTANNLRLLAGFPAAALRSRRPEEAAAAVVEAAAAGRREASFPAGELAPLLWLRPFVPGLLDAVFRRATLQSV